MKTLSIIITAHNLYPLITHCLSSVKDCLLYLAEGEYEVLLIDDQSADGTGKAMLEFSEKNKNVRYFRTEFGNIGKVRNYAIAQASGDYITFVDGDDILPNFDLSCLVRFLQNTLPDIVLSRLHEVYKPEDLKKAGAFSLPEKMKKHSAIQVFLVHKQFQSHLWGKYFRRDLFDDIKIPEVVCYEDALVFPDLLMAANKIYYTRTVIYNYIKRKDSLTTSRVTAKPQIKADVVEHMRAIFGDEYRYLIACHAIDLLLKSKSDLSALQVSKLTDLFNEIQPLKFIFATRVRLSFKRKYFQLKRQLNALPD